MKVGAFQLDEPIPELSSPHAFAVLRPWINVGDAGSLAIDAIETQLDVKTLGKLSRPGQFYDFTRYRPQLYFLEGRRRMDIPNTTINYAQRTDENDLVFLSLMEPHMFGEYYSASVVKVLRLLGVTRYMLIGAMYDSVPHTRPLIVSGSATGSGKSLLEGMGVQPSSYEGPGTITQLIAQEASKHGIETASMVVHLPQYTQLDEDYTAQLRLLELLCNIYNFPVDLDSIDKEAKEQYRKISVAVEREPQLKQVVQRLEEYYEDRSRQSGYEKAELSPEIEQFLNDIDQHFNQN